MNNLKEYLEALQMIKVKELQNFENGQFEPNPNFEVVISKENVREKVYQSFEDNPVDFVVNCDQGWKILESKINFSLTEVPLFKRTRVITSFMTQGLFSFSIYSDPSARSNWGVNFFCNIASTELELCQEAQSCLSVENNIKTTVLKSKTTYYKWEVVDLEVISGLTATFFIEKTEDNTDGTRPSPYKEKNKEFFAWKNVADLVSTKIDTKEKIVKLLEYRKKLYSYRLTKPKWLDSAILKGFCESFREEL